MSATLPEDVEHALARGGLMASGAGYDAERLTGGVSSDIWKVETDERVFCVKRALAKLNVAADWQVPIERNRYEVAWCRIANDLVPGVAPEILLFDEQAMLCAMGFLDPSDHRLWKQELHEGHVSLEAATAVGKRMALIHAGTAGKAEIAATFPDRTLFPALRLEPYLEATAERHPDLADRLYGLSRRTAAIDTAMIHGDVSPKNILIGPDGPVFLDSECACMGDPAFDLAFCLNHLLLKCLWTPTARDRFLEAFEAMVSAYLQRVTWEANDAVHGRAARLLPGLFLARVDGKSPVEYVTDEADKDKVRRVATHLLLKDDIVLRDIVAAWRKELTQ